MKNLYRKLSIKYKIAFLTSILIIAGVVILATILFNKQRELLISEMKARGLLILRNLQQAGREAILNDDTTITTDMINEIMKEKSILRTYILNKEGVIIDHSDHSLIGEKKEELSNLKKVNIRETGEYIEISGPIVIEAHGKTGILGYAGVQISKVPMEKAINQAKKEVILITLLLIFGGIILSFLYSITITNPIRKIVEVMEKVGKGDLNQRVDIKLQDEIGKLATSFNEMIKHLREKLMMKKFISGKTAEMISMQSTGELKLGGERKTVTLLFSDIRNFTAFSETHKPEEVIEMLNTYLSVQAEIIERHNGDIDKYVGDEVVAIFEGKNMVENAIKAAIEIQKTIKKKNEKAPEKINVGIGINTGVVVMGNMGSKDRMDYTAIGDNVNIASRLCSVAPPKEILVSENSFKYVKGKFKVKKELEISVKGKEKPLKVYAIDY